MHLAAGRIARRFGTVGFLVILGSACTKRNLRPCSTSEECDYRPGGQCVLNSETGTSWCAFADAECPGGLRWGDATVGDDLAGTCALGSPDADCGAPGCGDVDAALPCNSPDRLTYLHAKPSSGFDIYSVDPDGTNSLNVTNTSSTGVAQEAEYSWDRQGQRIAYTSLESSPSIWTVNGDGTERDRLTTGAFDTHPSWSPDGEHVGFTRGESALGPYIIHVIPFDSALPSPASSGDEDHFPAWSPTSTEIAFFSNRDGAEGLYLSDASGPEDHPLSLEGGAVGHVGLPRWSPTGAWIAFLGYEGSQQDVWVIDTDGRELRNVTMSADDETSVQWMPDGERLIYTVNNDIHVINSDGTNDIPLIATATAERDAVVNPNGTRVAWVGNADGNWEVYVAPVDDAANVTRITNNSVTDSFPAWRPCQ
jgi:Tol biopolymer transport system component